MEYPQDLKQLLEYTGTETSIFNLLLGGIPEREWQWISNAIKKYSEMVKEEIEELENKNWQQYIDKIPNC